jgi:ABC-type transport system involved in cytochrome c biogenesis permease component
MFITVLHRELKMAFRKKADVMNSLGFFLS